MTSADDGAPIDAGSDSANAASEASEASERARDGVRVEFGVDRTRVVLSGEVDLAADSDLHHAADLAIEPGRPITLDVGDVAFIDSIGLAFVARVTAAEHQVGRRLQVVGAATGVRQLLIVSGLSDLVDFVDG